MFILNSKVLELVYMKKKRCSVFLLILCLSFFIAGTNAIAQMQVKAASIQENNQKKEQNGEVQSFAGEELVEKESGEKTANSEYATYSRKSYTKNLYSGHYGYKQLSLSEQKTVYLLLEEAANNFQNSSVDAITNTNENGEKSYYAVSVPVNGIISASNVGEAVVCFLYDHPEYFWSKGYSYYVRTEDKMVTKVQLQCQEEYCDGNVRKQMWDKIQDEISGYMQMISGIRTDYEKELLIHDALADKITYAYISGTKSPETARWAHTIEGVFSDEHYSVVCEGYAKAFQLLLNAAGIENVYVVGKAGGTGHAWNQVKIEGEWYNVDLTWNDTGDNKSHKYFNLPDTSFTISHKAYASTGSPTVGEWCYSTNVCTATEYSYTNKGDYKKGTTHVLSIEKTKDADVKVYNQGIEVASGAAVDENTILEVVVMPYNTKDILQVNVNGDSWEENYEGVVSASGISYKFPMVMDHKIAVHIRVPAQKIKLSKTSLVIDGYGVKKSLTAQILPKATEKKILWSCSNPKVATVKNGMIQSVSKGSAIITASAESGTVYARCKVTVKAPSIKITTARSKLKVGKTVQFKASLKGINKTVRWSVSNKRKATIGSRNGKLKAKKAGTVWIYAKAGNYMAKKKITIVPRHW